MYCISLIFNSGYYVFTDCIRYQNQRHPANRPNKSGAQDMSMSLAGSVPISDQVPSHVLSTAMKKEALLPTPPSHQIVKLDTSLTCEFLQQILSKTLMTTFLYSSLVSFSF